MKNILKIFITTCFIGGSVYAQQIPLTSQYMFNDYLLNPAVAGSTDSINISLSARAQWTGLEGAPKTQFFSIDSKIGEKMGVGGYVYNDETGPISERGVQLSYAYHLKVGNKSNLAFSLAGMMFFHNINTAQFRPEEGGDEALQTMKINAVSPDVNFGMMYYTNKYRIGFSSSQLLENDLYGITAAGDNNLNKLARHYYLFADYKIEASDKITVVPSALMKYLQGAPIQFDVNARMIYDNKFWLGASYRYNNAVVALVGVNYKNLSFGYSYDYTLTEIRDFSTGGHEVFLSLKLPSKPTIKSAPSIN